MNRIFTILMVAILLTGLAAYAATDNPTIDANTRDAVLQVTTDYIEANTVGGVYRFYDVVTNEFVRLNFKKLHSGIRTTGDFFNSCANFENEAGVHYDMDFLLIQKEDGSFAVTQPYVHGVGKQQRPFHP
jgi:hypothetical protein